MAKCIPVPKFATPKLDASLSAKGPSFTTPSFDPNLCCKLPQLPAKKVEIPIPPFIAAKAVALLEGVSDAINDFVDKLPLSCPRE